MADEIHSDIVYPGSRHTPFGALDEPFARKALIAVNPSKTFNTAGLRGAAFICPDKHVRKALIAEQIRSKSYGRPIFGAESVEVLYTECEYYADQIIPYLHANIRLIADRLRPFANQISFVEPEATYLLWLDCRNLGLSQPELRDFFLTRARLLLNDGETFGPEGAGFMRLNVASPRAVIGEAMDRLTAALESCRTS
jgi:cystathionine beta-lyase